MMGVVVVSEILLDVLAVHYGRGGTSSLLEHDSHEFSLFHTADIKRTNGAQCV